MSRITFGIDLFLLHLFSNGVFGRKLFLFIISVVGCVGLLNAQEATANIIPPSPNASSLAKFVESPVSLYSGTASAHIPLMSISNQEMSIDFSLKYDGKGIMVAETPSSVGAGWSLSGGGIITRQVRGRPDERANGYLTFFYSKDFETSSSTRSSLLSSVISYQNSEHPLDQEPDIYFVSFLGRSVKFVINNFDKTPVLQSTEDLKINITYTGEDSCVNSGNNCKIDRFEIIDEKGFRYYFGQDCFGARSTYDKLSISETNKIGYTKTRNEDGYRTSWHLLEIITPTNNKITFTYREEKKVISFDKSDVKSNNSRGPDYETYITKSTHKQMVLDEVIFPEGKLKFDYHKSQREDLLGSYALVGIRKIDVGGRVIKNVIFEQEYIDDQGQNNDVSIFLLNDDPHSKKRMFLNQVISKNYDEGEEAAKKHTFEYNETKLPNRHSTSIDRWGYFNGAKNSQNLAERGNNRNVVGSKAEAGILKKIIYPTGGEELFEYEDHIVFLPSYFEEIVFADEISEAYKTINDGMIKAPQYYVSYGQVGKYEREIPIENGHGLFEYRAELDEIKCEDIETPNCPFKVRLYFYSTTDELLSTHVITQGSGSFSYDTSRASYFKVVVSNPNFTLLDRDDFASNQFMLRFTWQQKKPIEEFGGDIIGGGRRIQSITTLSENSRTKREFTYNNKEGSTGVLLGIPEYFNLLESHFILGRRINLIAGQILNPLRPMAGFSQSGAVGYYKVKENLVSEDNNKNGIIEYSFSNFLDGGKYYRWPYHQPDDLSWARGILLKKKISDVAGNLKQEIDYQYKYFEDSGQPYRQYKDYEENIANNESVDYHNLIPYSQESILPHYYFSHDFQSLPLYLFGAEGGSLNSLDPNEYRVAFFYGGTIKLKKEIIKRYEYGNSTETQKTYKYPTTGHHQVLKETYTFPDGVEKEVSYKYAHEKNNDLLISKNMVAIPLQTITTKKFDGGAAKTISNVETKYPNCQGDADDKTSGLPLPFAEVIYDLQNTNTFTTQITYDKYDANNGNLLQFSKNGEIPTSIIWGYNNTKPIAIVEGAIYDQIPYLTGNINIIDASNNDVLTIPGASESSLLDTLNNFRNHAVLKNFQITTYTYDPLIGMRSLTPPNGMTEFYEYDKGRLKTIKNINGQVLKEFMYRYRR